MENKKNFLWVGIGFIVLSLLVSGLSFFPDWMEHSEPAIIFLTLTAIFFFIQYFAPHEWTWRGWLFLPTCFFTAFGIIFTFNTLTSDWNSWAYAWLFGITGLAIGMALAIRETRAIPPLYYQISIWTALTSLSLFCIFGAVAGGTFIRFFILALLAFLAIGLVLFLKNNKQGMDWSRLWTMPATAQPEKGAPAEPVELLSKRELEVLHWIEQGLTNAEIAARLVVATSTVKTHINNIYTKLDVTTRTGALRRAKELGLL